MEASNRPFPVREVFANSTLEARIAVLELVDRSAWFEVTPLPNDIYVIRIKPELAPPLLAERFAHIAPLATSASDPDEDGGIRVQLIDEEGHEF